MKIKYKLILPMLIATTACNSVPAPISLTGEAANAIKLLAGSTAVAKSDSEILAVDYDKSAVGSTVTATSLNELSDVTIKILSPVAGKSAISISGTSSEGELNTVVASDNLNLFLQTDLATQNIAAINEENTIMTVNGTKIYIYAGDKIKGTTEFQEGHLAMTSEDGESVSGIFRYANVGGEEANVLGYANSADGVFTVPTTGSYDYSGVTVLFAPEGGHISTTSKMSVDFSDLSGSYSADTFDEDDGLDPLTIKLASDITLNNTTGEITGSNGTINIGGTSSAMKLIGIMNVGNEEVAGSIVTNDSTKSNNIFGGVFGLTKK
jgi:hypothetical protein